MKVLEMYTEVRFDRKMLIKDVEVIEDKIRKGGDIDRIKKDVSWLSDKYTTKVSSFRRRIPYADGKELAVSAAFHQVDMLEQDLRVYICKMMQKLNCEYEFEYPSQDVFIMLRNIHETLKDKLERAKNVARSRGAAKKELQRLARELVRECESLAARAYGVLYSERYTEAIGYACGFIAQDINSKAADFKNFCEEVIEKMEG